jgi:hypothetical protein
MSATTLASTQCPRLNQNQLDVLEHAHRVGLKFNLEHTLPAIALTESSAGEYLANETSKDYGVYQINRKTICDQAGLTPGSTQCNREVFEVLVNIQKSDEHAVKVLLYWRNYHKKKSSAWYENMIRSYNTGFSYKNTTADTYWSLYKKNLRIVKSCTKMFT